MAKRKDGRNRGDSVAPTSTEERVAWWALLAMVMLVPVAVGRVPFIGTTSFMADFAVVPKIAVIATCVTISMVAWAIGVVRGAIELRSVPAGWWLAGVMATAIGSGIAGPGLHISVWGSEYAASGLLVFLLSASTFGLSVQLVNSARRIHALAWAVVAGALLPAFIAVLQAAGTDPIGISNTIDLRRGGSTLGNPNLTGTYLVLPVVLSATLALAAGAARERAVAWACFALTLGALGVTLTRGAWLGAAVGLIVLAVVLARRGTGGASIRLLLFSLVAAVVAALMSGLDRIIGRFSDLGGAGPFGSGRLVLWKDALRVIAEQPFLGTGPDSYRLGWYAVRSAESVRLTGLRTVSDDPHSVPLLLAATIGVPAALVVMGVFAWILWSAIGRVFDGGSKIVLVYAGWWAALIGFGVSLLVSVNGALIMMLLAVATAVLVTPASRRVESTVVVRRTVAGVPTALCMVALTMTLLTVSADTRLWRAATAQDRVVALEAAARTAPWYARANYQAAAGVAEGILSRLQVAAPGLGPAAVDAEARIRALIARNPQEYASHALLAYFLTNASPVLDADALTRGRDAAIDALEVYPVSAEAAQFKALFELEMGQPELAADTLERIWDIDPTYADAGVVYVQALAQLGRNDEALQVIGELERRVPDDPAVVGLRRSLESTPAQ